MKTLRFGHVFAIVFLLAAGAFAYGEDQIVTLSDGKQAVLHDGFTWEYYSAPTAISDSPSIQDNKIPRYIIQQGAGSVTFRGAEMGNALATTFGASSGLVGRNIYVPIYLCLPLPSRISNSIFRGIQAQSTFRSHYQRSGSEWRLTSQVPLSQRGQFWTMLEAAGYDASAADFKTDRKLNPVTLEFAIGPLSKGSADLVELRLVSSSGSAEVDEAVIYGFRQASFFNKTGKTVAGKFVYSF